MTDILLAVVLAMQTVTLWAVVCMVAKKAPEPDEVPDEARRGRQMDEGFDNLMTYTVKLGHGRETGGEP